MSCEHCQSKHNAMLMARDNADYHKADLNKARAENDLLKADYDKLFVVKHNLEVELAATEASLDDHCAKEAALKRENERLLAELTDATERAAYTWTAEAEIAWNLKEAIEDAADILEEDGRRHAAKVLREAAQAVRDDLEHQTKIRS